LLSRRAILALPFAAACGSRSPAGYRGYAFVANQDGQAVAAVDLQAMAVVRHIPLDGSPSQVVAANSRPSVYVLTPETGSVHEIQSDRLNFRRKLTVASKAVTMQIDAHEHALYVLARDPQALLRISLDSFKLDWRIALPESPSDMALASDGNIAAVGSGSSMRLVDLAGQHLGRPLAQGDFGAVRFLSDGQTLVGADRSARILSLFDVASSRLITNLPVAVRPDNLCFNQDGGQLFITGEGLDGVVVVYPYHTPEVAETVLAGRAPQAMAASASYLLVASPQSGDVSILNIATRRVLKPLIPVGGDPGFITVTPDDQYALVLNRKSGDVAVLAVESNGSKPVSLRTIIPVGSRPVCAAVRAV